MPLSGYAAKCQRTLALEGEAVLRLPLHLGRL